MKTFLNTIQQKKLFGFLPLLHLIGIITGGLGGYAYYYYIGCVSGTCSITSNPWMSIAWGMAVGYLLFDLFYKGKKQHRSEDKS
jgi:hypothetical protein